MDERMKADISRMEEKMGKLLDDMTGHSNGMFKTAAATGMMYNSSYKQYRSSFLTLGDMQIPDDYREIFRWCRYFFKFDSLIGAAVRSLATFPVTDWLLNDTENSDDEDSENQSEHESEEPSETYKFYESVLNEIKLYSHMIEVGYDYFLYGNCVVFAEPGIKNVKRRDPDTGQIYEKKEVVWKSVQRLDVTRLRIDRDPKTNEKQYYYDIPLELKRVIQTQKPKEKFDRIPEIFKKAVKAKGLVKLKSDYIYHLQMPSESGDSGLWATPPVLHAMKLILYSNVLRQAQEAIAYEHIIPKRIYYFQETQEYSPNMDFASIASEFALELKRQLDDPNYQVISPFPINQLMHGGQGKALMLVPELEQLQETILAAMGTPREFVFGGVSYSGSTTSLRILENQFITYRSNLLDYINDFLIKRLAEIRGEWETIDDDKKLVNVQFSELKMQDDIQQKQIMVNLNESGKLPDEVLYEKVLGLDASKTIKQLQAERIRKLKEQAELQINQMEIEKEMQMEAMQRGLMNPPVPVNGPVVPEPAAGAYGQATEGDPMMSEGGGDIAGESTGGQATSGSAPSSTDSSSGSSQSSDNKSSDKKSAESGSKSGREQRDALKIAQQMELMTEAQKANLIRKLPQKEAQRVLLYYNQLKADNSQSDSGDTDMRPYPEQRPPRRTVGGV